MSAESRPRYRYLGPGKGDCRERYDRTSRSWIENDYELSGYLFNGEPGAEPIDEAAALRWIEEPYALAKRVMTGK